MLSILFVRFATINRHILIELVADNGIHLFAFTFCCCCCWCIYILFCLRAFVSSSWHSIRSIRVWRVKKHHLNSNIIIMMTWREECESVFILVNNNQVSANSIHRKANCAQLKAEIRNNIEKKTMKILFVTLTFKRRAKRIPLHGFCVQCHSTVIERQSDTRKEKRKKNSSRPT